MEYFPEMYHETSKAWINFFKKAIMKSGDQRCFQMPIVRDKILGDYDNIDRLFWDNVLLHQ